MGKYTEAEQKAVGWFNGGYTLMISDLFEEAIEAFNEAINLDPNLGGFYTMRGYCYYKLEKSLTPTSFLPWGCELTRKIGTV